MPTPKFEDTEPLFEETEALDTASTAASIGGQAGSQASAKAAFESGQSRASFYPDLPGKREGVQQFANPVSGPAAFAAGALRGATELPFVGNLAGRAITAATGQNLDDFKTFEEAAAQQQIGTSATGELAGALVLAPAALEGAGKAFLQSAKGLGKVLLATSELATSNTVKYGARTMKYLFGGGLGKTATLLLDQAALGNPKMLAKDLQEIKPVLTSVNTTIEKIADKVGDILPDIQKHNTTQLRSLIETDLLSTQTEKPASYVKRVTRALNDWISSQGEKVWTTKEKLQLARKIDGEARTFKLGRATRTEMANGEILSDMARSLRDSVSHDVTQAATVSGDSTLIKTFEQANGDYSKLAKTRDILESSLRNHKRQEILDAGLQRTAQLLGKGEKLGKFFKVLKKAAQYGLPTATRLHTNLLDRNEEYRQVVQQIDQEDQPVR